MRAPPRFRSFVIAVAMLASGVSATRASAQAQPQPAQPGTGDQAAVARALFQEGVGFSDRGEWASAADRFRRALALRNLPVIAHNLGVALSRLHRYVEASEVLLGVSRDASASQQVRDAAEEEYRRATPHIGRLTVVVEGDPRGAVITLDGRPLEEALFDVARPIDPGRHVVRAMRGDEEVATEQVTIGDGRSESITIDVGEASIDDVAGPGGRRRRRSGGGVLTQWWFWTIVGVVAVGAGTAAIVATTSGGEDPYRGSFEPGQLTFR